MLKTINVILFTTYLMAVPAHASVVTYTDKAAWENAVGSFTTLDFTGGQDGFLFPLDYYADLGVTFTGQHVGYFHSCGLFPNDCEGIRANNPTLWAHFDEPQFAVGVDFPGGIRLEIWHGEELIFSSLSFFGTPIGFAGLISEQPFDAVFLYRAGTDEPFVYLDDLHFASLPAPGALGLFGLVALALRRRRRPGGPI